MPDLAPVRHRAVRRSNPLNQPDIRGYEKQITSALEYAANTYTFEDVCKAVSEGRLQFWPGPNSVVITEIIEYPQYRTLNYFLAGGNLAELAAMLPRIEAWGRMQNCTRAILIGRKGWERTFITQEGYAPELVVFGKTL